jgi:hypothetical protein
MTRDELSAGLLRAATHRGLRSIVAGAVLIAVAFGFAHGTGWFAPLLVAAGILLAIGLLGPRMRGRIALEFGPEGTVFELSTHVAPVGQVGRLSEAPAPAPAAVADADAVRLAAEREPQRALDPEADVIEGEAHTTEFSVTDVRG